MNDPMLIESLQRRIDKLEKATASLRERIEEVVGALAKKPWRDMKDHGR